MFGFVVVTGEIVFCIIHLVVESSIYEKKENGTNIVYNTLKYSICLEMFWEPLDMIYIIIDCLTPVDCAHVFEESHVWLKKSFSHLQRENSSTSYINQKP